MIFANDACLDLTPSFGGVFGFISDLQARWWRAEFDPARCADALARLAAERHLPEGWFDPSQILRGGVAATDSLLFDHFAGPKGDAESWRWRFRSARAGVSFDQPLTSDAVSEISAIIRAASRCRTVSNFKRVCRSFVDEESLDILARAPGGQDFGKFPAITRPGIYRREHASVVFRSETTTLMIDPQALNSDWTTNHSRFPGEKNLGKVDAVLITHHHNDHWHLPSILRYASSAKIPVIVPSVPRVNLLTPEDFKTSLTLAGQEVVAPPWHSTVRVGDFEIDILPFYGEQPIRSAPSIHPDLRSWGNCYRVSCPAFSAVVLVDSGVDPSGDADTMLQGSYEKRGPVDFLLSCALTFPEAINPGLPHYMLTVPFERLTRIFREQKEGRWSSITAGPSGVAASCASARATYYLPYAHGFQGVGEELRRDGEVITDRVAAREVQAELKKLACPTIPLVWNPGHFVDPRGVIAASVRAA